MCKNIIKYYTHAHYHSAIINEEILSFVTNWEVPDGIKLSEIGQRQAMYDLTYMWNVKTKKQNQKKDQFRGHPRWG